MELQGQRRVSRWTFPLCLGLSALFLLICTKSSPLYPLNDWVDVNIYFTIGKGMFHGVVPYAQLYDQKGPMVYLLYGLASLVSGKSYFGVYLLETLSFALFLLAVQRILSLYVEKNTLLVLPIFAAAILGSLSFSHGGSLEEVLMPLFAWSLYDTLRYFKNDYPAPVPLGMIARNAFFAGLMLYAKFILLAFYVAWMGVFVIAQFAQKQWKRALLSGALFILVMVGVGIPWVIYFAANGALKDFFYYYFYQNIFGYSYLDDPLILTMPIAIVKSVGAFSFRNPQIALFIALGLFWFAAQKRALVKTIEKVNYWLLAAFLAAGIYCGGQGYRYYGLVLTPFMALGFVPLLRLWNRRADAKFKPRVLRIALYGALTLVMLAAALWTTDNRYMLFTAREETPQYRFAAVLKQKDAKDVQSLLCYGFPDAGFYQAAGVIPEYPFFATSNVAMTTVKEEQARYVAEKLPAFIVTRNWELEQTGYTLLDTMDYTYEDGMRTYRLYERVG